MQTFIAKPKNRGVLRLRLGGIYFTLKRYIFWLFGGVKFARKSDKELKFTHFSHQSPLLR